MNMEMNACFVCEKCSWWSSNGLQSPHSGSVFQFVRSEGSNWCVACVRHLINSYEGYKRNGWGKLLVLYETGKTHAVGHVFDGLLHLHVGAGQFRKLSPEEYNEEHGTQATVMTEAKCLREMIAVVRPGYVPSWESIDD